MKKKKVGKGAVFAVKPGTSEEDAIKELQSALDGLVGKWTSDGVLPETVLMAAGLYLGTHGNADQDDTWHDMLATFVAIGRGETP